jgi:DNA-binding NtrC family response regulator
VSKARILCVDDDVAQRRVIAAFLRQRGHEITEAATAAEATAQFRRDNPDLVVLDYMLPDDDGLAVLAALRDIDGEAAVIMVTGHGDVELAVEAIRSGADNFLVKPLSLEALETVVERALDQRRARRRQRAGRASWERRKIDPFRGESPAIRALARDAAVAARADSPVLLVGETGSGKGVIARWLHDESPRSDEAFVDLNCAGLPRDLLESELFGHARGAFTGAVAAKPGLIETAHRGTLFLDEVGELDPAVQPKLLKVLEQKSFRRVGEVHERRAETRLLAATNRDLAEAIATGRFRSDLYYRLNIFVLRLPALRERPEDVPQLVGDMLERLGDELGRHVEVAPETLAALAAHDWPGNVRELRNVLERAILVAREPRLRPADLNLGEGQAAAAPRAAPPASVGDELLGTLAEIERRALRSALARTGGRVPEAAKLLAIPRSTLYSKLRTFGLRPRDFADGGAA